VKRVVAIKQERVAPSRGADPIWTSSTLVGDYERRIDVSQAMILVAMGAISRADTFTRDFPNGLLAFWSGSEPQGGRVAGHGA
jgi:hypothetical protein